MDTNSRLILFCLLFCLLSLWEISFPSIKNSANRKVRWVCNLLIILSGQLVVKGFLYFGTLVWAEGLANEGFGLFNVLKINDLPPILSIAISLLTLDFLIYFQHLICHRISFFWRFHRAHHMENFLDATSALRFHPVEIGFSYIYKVFWLVVLGIPLELFLIFEILLSSMALFNHSNIKIPYGVDRFLRKLIVTPDFHRIHHYAHNSYMHTNFGFNLSLWDYMFKTYKSDEQCPLDKSDMGIPSKPEKVHNFLWLLKSPFNYRD